MSETRQMLAFGDESGTFSCRYQAVCVVSGESDNAGRLREELAGVLASEGVHDVKFEKVGTHSATLNAARECLLRGVKGAAARLVRVDVLIWDTHDSRHSVVRRDDVANLERMYYWVLRHAVMQLGGGSWSLKPDAGSEVDWTKMREVLCRTRTRGKSTEVPLWGEFGRDQRIVMERVEPVDSGGEPLVQLADLFAGLGRFSREEGSACVRWLETWGRRRCGQGDLFCDGDVDEATKARQNRYLLVDAVRAGCGRYRLGVSLSSKRCLWTAKGSNPVNFWHYEPQGEYDRAPTR